MMNKIVLAGVVAASANVAMAEEKANFRLTAGGVGYAMINTEVKPDSGDAAKTAKTALFMNRLSDLELAAFHGSWAHYGRVGEGGASGSMGLGYMVSKELEVGSWLSLSMAGVDKPKSDMTMWELSPYVTYNLAMGSNVLEITGSLGLSSTTGKTTTSVTVGTTTTETEVKTNKSGTGFGLDLTYVMPCASNIDVAPGVSVSMSSVKDTEGKTTTSTTTIALKVLSARWKF